MNNKIMSGFIDFIRKQGIVGLAVGFILGGAISKVVAALVEDIINPILGVVLGKAGSLATTSFAIGTVDVLWGHFIGAIIDLVVYYCVKGLKLDQLDKKD